jgi:protease I
MARQIKVACLLGDGFEDTEFRAPYERMRREGFDVVIIGARKGAELRGKRGKEQVRADAGIDEMDPSDFDLLFIPGGNSPDQLRANPRFVEFVKRFDEQGKPIAAICHGPQLLMSARRVKGRMLTAWKTIQVDLDLAGANVRDEPVVIDRNLITSRQPEDVPQFSDAIVRYMHGARGAEAISHQNA